MAGGKVDGKRVALGTASLDRIDSRKGYEPQNIQWVLKEVNLMKGAMPQGHFITLCNAVVSHRLIV
jgi:hypothetical protein